MAKEGAPDDENNILSPEYWRKIDAVQLEEEAAADEEDEADRRFEGEGMPRDPDVASEGREKECQGKEEELNQLTGIQEEAREGNSTTNSPAGAHTE